MKVVLAATNVAELLRRQAVRNGTTTALIDGSHQVSWADLDSNVDALARGMSELGAVAGHRVAIDMVNSIEFVTAYLAALRAGLVAVPMNPTATVGEAAHVLADSGSRLCFADGATVETIRAVLTGAVDHRAAPDGDCERPGRPELIVVDAGTVSGERRYDGLAAPRGQVASPRDAETLATLLYPTDATGRPRAAMLSHRALLANVDQVSRIRPAPMAPTDVVLGVVPLFDVYGLNAVLGQVLLQGSTLVLGRQFDAAETLHLIGSEQITCAPVTAQMITAWSRRNDLRERLAGIRTLFVGISPPPRDVVRAFEERSGVTVEEGYGLPEAGPMVTATVGAPERKPGSSGRTIPGVELAIVDDTGHQLQTDDAGEIWVRGRNTYSGYWPDGAGGLSPEGWLATGDIGYLDAGGDLFLLDRLNEIVVVSGFHVYPSEVEDVVKEVDGVAECAVIGTPDPITGEALVAYLVGDEGIDQAALRAKVQRHCAERVARFKRPAEVEVVPRLPHSGTGNVAKSQLRAALARRPEGQP